jgi:hypothetical protein
MVASLLRLAVAIVMIGCLTMPGAMEWCRAAAPVSPFSRGITLRQMLVKGLKARRPIEFEYLDTIVLMVDRGELPESLVRSTIFWAWQRYSNPLQFFQVALAERAARVGLYAPGADSALSTLVPTPPGQGNNGNTGNPDSRRADTGF